MAAGFTITFDGGTEEQYRAVHSRMRMDEKPPAGADFPLGGPGRWGLESDRFPGVARGIRPVPGVRVWTGSPRAWRPAFKTPPDIAEFPVTNVTKP